MARLEPLHPHIAWRRFPGLARDLVQRRPRSFLADCQAMLKQVDVTWVDGENVPTTGPFCLVANHYQRPGLWIGWTGALVSVAVAERRGGEVPRWLVLGDLPIQLGRWRFSLPGAAWAFERVATVWGLVPMTGFENAVNRAHSLRRLLGLLRAGEGAGFFPEGASGTAARLGPALPGTGRFLRLLARRGVAIIPVGVREADGKLVARFGRPITGWPDDREGPPDDRQLGAFVMQQIAACLESPTVQSRTTLEPWQ